MEAILGNLLFSPSGRVSPANFLRGAYVLIAVTFLINLMPMVSVALGSVLKILLLVIYYCWVALFIKRFHDGGKSGWMVFLPTIVFVIASMIIGQIVPPIFAPEIYGNMQEAMLEVTTSGGDVGSIMAATMEISREYGEPLAKKIALPSSVIYALMSFAIVFLFNSWIKHEPQDNQYGPA